MKSLLHILVKRQQKSKGIRVLPILLLALVVMALAACSDDSPTIVEGGTPISFVSAEQEEQNVSRATTPLGRDFTVWGHKTVGGSAQTVFQGYKVTFLSNTAGTSADNTHDYFYVDPGTGQTIKFWDFSADAYNFWGATGGTFSGDGGTTLILEDLVQTLTEPEVDDRLFTALYHRSPVTSDVVALQFKRPYAKVRIMFYSGDELEDGDIIEITNVSFTPEAPTEIVAEGTMTVSYPTTGLGPETYTTTPSATTATLGFDGVTLDHIHGNTLASAVTAAPTGGTEYYYAVPNDYDAPFVLSADIDGDEKMAVVPATMMHWQPNYVYTYVFKITDAGKKIEVYDVLIDPWQYGGSQDAEWKNW